MQNRKARLWLPAGKAKSKVKARKDTGSVHRKCESFNRAVVGRLKERQAGTCSKWIRLFGWERRCWRIEMTGSEWKSHFEDEFSRRDHDGWESAGSWSLHAKVNAIWICILIVIQGLRRFNCHLHNKSSFRDPWHDMSRWAVLFNKHECLLCEQELIESWTEVMR